MKQTESVNGAPTEADDFDASTSDHPDTEVSLDDFVVDVSDLGVDDDDDDEFPLQLHGYVEPNQQPSLEDAPEADLTEDGPAIVGAAPAQKKTPAAEKTTPKRTSADKVEPTLDVEDETSHESIEAEVEELLRAAETDIEATEMAAAEAEADEIKAKATVTEPEVKVEAPVETAEAVTEAPPETVEAEQETVEARPETVEIVEIATVDDVVEAADLDSDSDADTSIDIDIEDESVDSDEPSGFAALGLRSDLLSTLGDLGYANPTPIQRETIPHLMGGNDLLGQAATGTGKTAAFALPIVNTIDKGDPAKPVALILVPTRELAVQVSEAIFGYGRAQNVRVMPVYGGQPIYTQLKALKRGVHVVVATPGRAIDHIKRGSLALDQIRTVVLDEADEMLDMGFTEDIETILQSTPANRQTVLFSATMPPRINAIAKRYQRDPIRIQIGVKEAAEAKALIKQTVYFVHWKHKAAALGRILDVEAPKSALVFCRTRNDVDDLSETMNNRGYRAEALHGGMDQSQRDRVMGRLRDGTAQLLIATDVAARGLDIDTLTHVVNYDVPTAPESYVHRIGRVGRAGREGVAITLTEPKNRRLLSNIEHLLKKKIEVGKVPSVADLRTLQLSKTVEVIADAATAMGGSGENARSDIDEAALNTMLDKLVAEDGAELGDDPEARVRAVALAAMKLIHVARNPMVDNVEIPDAAKGKHDGGGKFGNKGGGKGRFNKQGAGRGGSGGYEGRSGSGGGAGGKGRPLQTDGDTGLVYVNLGRKAGIRPGDLVGAIANETGLAGREIGPIKINDGYSVVGVPEKSVKNVISAISATTVKGKKAKARPYQP